MKDEFYKILTEQLPVGYAYHKIICDEFGAPIDYMFLEVNKAFETMTGLVGQKILGKCVTEVIPGIKEDRFNWIGEYGNIAQHGGSMEFESYTAPLNKWYRVNVTQPEQGHFVTFFTDITKEVSELNEHKILLTALNDAVFELGESFVFENVITPDETILNLKKNNVVGKSINEFFSGETLSVLMETFHKAKHSAKKETVSYRSEPDDKWYQAEIKYIEINSQSKYVINISDITEKKRMEESLFFEKKKFQTTLLSIGDGVISLDTNRNVVFMNQVAEELTGRTFQASKGMPFELAFPIVHETTREAAHNPVIAVLTTGKPAELANHTVLLRPDGTELCIEDSASPIRDAHGEMQGVVLVFRDVTEKRKIRNEIEYISYHDYLTGLYNRRFFEEELARLNNKQNLPLSVVMLDVNGLKLTNDAFGHETGDELLKKVAGIITDECIDDAIIARTGGDEFAVILPKTDTVQAEIICARLNRKTQGETVRSVILSVAVGHATKTKASQDMSEVVKTAENNMYRNKISTSKKMRNRTLRLIIDTLNKKYEEEQIHNARVSKLCTCIGTALGLPPDELRTLEQTAWLHDIGKIMVPQDILNKPTKLDHNEMEQIRRHAESGYQILKSVEEYTPLAEYVLSHHERWDGKGYPRKLKGENIPLPARVICVADAYEAMTSGRIYKDAVDERRAVDELKRNAGKQFDPIIVKVFVEQVLHKSC